MESGTMTCRVLRGGRRALQVSLRATIAASSCSRGLWLCVFICIHTCVCVSALRTHASHQRLLKKSTLSHTCNICITLQRGGVGRVPGKLATTLARHIPRESRPAFARYVSIYLCVLCVCVFRMYPHACVLHTWVLKAGFTFLLLLLTELVDQCLSRAQHILEPNDRDLPYEHGRKVSRPRRLEWCDGVQLGVDRMVLKTGRSQYVKDLRQWLMLWGTLPSHTGANTSAGVITRQEVASMVPAGVFVCVCVCVCECD
jgi:hypothetical protein